MEFLELAKVTIVVVCLLMVTRNEPTISENATGVFDSLLDFYNRDQIFIETLPPLAFWLRRVSSSWLHRIKRLELMALPYVLLWHQRTSLGPLTVASTVLCICWVVCRRRVETPEMPLACSALLGDLLLALGTMIIVSSQNERELRRRSMKLTGLSLIMALTVAASLDVRHVFFLLLLWLSMLSREAFDEVADTKKSLVCGYSDPPSE